MDQAVIVSEKNSKALQKKLGLGSEACEDLWSVAFRKVVEIELV